MRALLPVVALVGCGRLGFDPLAGGDARFVDVASDVAAVCGDDVCEGNGGELCTTCAECATLAPVCGNGACDPGEVFNCYADCGPSPWTWPADTADLMAAINQARTGGTMCPGGGATQTAAALVYEPALEPFARELAWETAHTNWLGSVGCNGRSYADQRAMLGASAYWKVFNASSAQGAIAYLLGSAGSCNSIMDVAATQLGAAGAHDVIDAHVIVLR